MDALYQMTATELVDLYGTAATTPTDVLDASLGRYSELNRELNAVVTIDLEEMWAAAEASTSRWRSGKPLSKLDGVPISVKDNLLVGGLTATWGSEYFAQLVPEYDELAVARLRRAGAIIFGKTNTPELALAGYTSNRVFGSTGNPVDPALTPGGSSGGAAASVMSGMVPIALATDAAGSIRRPACYTGCAGIKTTVAAVPRHNGFPALSSDLQTIGPIARSFADLALALECLSGKQIDVKHDTLIGRRIGSLGAIPGHPVESSILSAHRACGDLLEQMGASVISIKPPFDPDEMGTLFTEISSAGVAATLADAIKTGFEPTPPIATLYDKGARMTAASYVQLLAQVVTMRHRIAEMFDRFDFLLTPTSAALPWPREAPYPAKIAGQDAGPRASAIYTTFVNVAGLPAINIPFASSPLGLPIGVQLIGSAGSDAKLLLAGHALKNSIPQPQVHP